MTCFIATFVGICFALWVRRRSMMRAALHQSAPYHPDPRELPRSAGQPVATVRVEKGTVDFSIATPRANNPRQPNKIVDRSGKKRQAPWHDIKHIPNCKSGHPSLPEVNGSNLVAVVLMITATIFIAATTVLAKALGTNSLGSPLHPIQITHGRFVFAFMALCTTLPAFWRHLNTKPNLGLHIGRTSLGGSGVCLMFAAVAYIPLSDATTISFLNPVFGMALAALLLGEKVGPWRWSAAAIALTGAFILLRPGPDSFQPAALLALGAAFFLGVELIFIKRLSGREPMFQILLTNNFIGCIVASVAVIAFWQPPTVQQWIALAALGALMACAQTCFVNAMKRAEASFIVVFSYSTLVFATIYDLVIFDVMPDAISILGAITILTGALLLAWREGRAKL